MQRTTFIHHRTNDGSASYWLVNQIAKAVNESIEPAEIIADWVALIRPVVGGNPSHDQRQLLNRATAYLGSFGI